MASRSAWHKKRKTEPHARARHSRMFCRTSKRSPICWPDCIWSGAFFYTNVLAASWDLTISRARASHDASLVNMRFLFLLSLPWDTCFII